MDHSFSSVFNKESLKLGGQPDRPFDFSPFSIHRPTVTFQYPRSVMLSSLIALSISIRVVSPVDPSDLIVVSAQSYLNSVLPFLFPDAHGLP
jgi:hypothetical protein